MICTSPDPEAKFRGDKRVFSVLIRVANLGTAGEPVVRVGPTSAAGPYKHRASLLGSCSTRRFPAGHRARRESCRRAAQRLQQTRQRLA